MKNIVFDIDGCLIDRTYQVTVPMHIFHEEVAALQQAGSSLHINSNRSLQDIRTIRDRMGFDGVIIYENGIGVFDPKRGDIQHPAFETFNRELLTAGLQSAGYEVLFADTDTVLRDPDRLSQFAGKEVVVCHDTRKYTATCYPRIVEDTLRKGDLQKLRDIVATILGTAYGIQQSEHYGNLTIVPVGAHKATGFSALQDTIASFGDDLPDISMFERSTLAGCPANAVPEVKETVKKLGTRGFIASQEFTAGAVEFLRYIRGTV